VCPNNYSENLISGFRKSGISPFNPQEVTDRLPKENNDGNVHLVSDVVVDMLKTLRYGDNNSSTRRRKSKINVQPGKSVVAEDLKSKDEFTDLTAGPSNTKGKQKGKIF